MSRSKRRRLGAVLYPKFELLDLYGPLEMFGCLPDDFEIVTVAETKGAVASSAGPESVARHDFADCPALDLLLLPGGIGTLEQLDSAPMLDFLGKRCQEVELCMTVCSGSAILARAGLLDGRRATSNKVFFSLAAIQSDRVHWVEKARWVEDGPFVTSSGVSAGTDMALAVIARLLGRARAEHVAIITEYEWQDDSARDPFHRYLNQAASLLKSAR